MRYRAEVDLPVYDGTPLVDRAWSGRPRLSRAPFEYEDVIAIIEYVKTLPFVSADLVGYMGMSHGGELQPDAADALAVALCHSHERNTHALLREFAVQS